MKLKLRNKIIDLSLVEEVIKSETSFEIVYNNGRTIEFQPDPIEIEVIANGNTHTLYTIIENKRLSENYTTSQLKEKLGVSSKGDGTYNLRDLEIEKEREVAKIEELNNLYDLFIKNMKKYEEVETITEI